MRTTTIHISTHARDLLQELAHTSGVSMQYVLEQALEQYRRQRLLDATNAAYAALQMDQTSWADLERERMDWDQTLADGLEEP